MAVLKIAVRGGGMATDVTYGLLVLSAINEMEFMDLVLSQDYKDIAREYFNGIIDDRTKLTSYWKGVGFDIPRVVSGQITGPMGALTLNTFEMTDKVISILTAFKNWQTEIRYDGLWYYFDFRRGGDSHEEAWELVEEQMGWAAKSPFTFRELVNVKNDNTLDLEQHFAALYEKWGPYATPNGISKEYKEQLAGELRQPLAAAIEENTDARRLYAEKKSVWDKFLVQLASIKNAIANIVSQVKNPFSAGPIIVVPGGGSDLRDVEHPSNSAEEFADDGLPQAVEVEPLTVEVQPPATTTETVEVGPPREDGLQADRTTTESVEVEPPVTEPEPDETRSDRVSSCRRETAGLPRQYRVLFSEVAWMGDEASPNNEWMELRNIWGLPVNLAGWQLQDRDQKIKLIFNENQIIPANEYFLLKRSKDYTGALNNSNEALYLFDNNCQIEDEALAQPNWPAGDNISKQTMQRFDALYWYTGRASAGLENSSPPAALAHPSAPAQTLVSQTSADNGSPQALSVVINEVAWAGTKANSADEWIELYNNTASSINLASWRLVADDNGPDITFPTSTISAGGYFLIERTDDNTISDILADWKGSFGSGLSNNGENLKLYDNLGNLIDSADFYSGWPAGQASPNYVSMERINSASSSEASNWAGNNRITRNGLDAGNPANQINGTPKAQNSVSKSFTSISGGLTLIEDATLSYFGNPYLVEGSITVSGAKLTVEPGVTVKFKHVGAQNQNSLLKIENGILEAIGTPDRKITFTSSSTQPAVGDWDGLYLENSSSTLNNVVVEYGGKMHQPSSGEFTAFTFGAIYIDGGNITLKNSLIEKSRTFGLWLKNSSGSQIIGAEFKENIGADHNGKTAAVLIENSSPTVKNSVFQNNIVGILTENDSAPTVKDNQFIQNTTPIQAANLLGDISGNTFQNNSIDGVLARGFGFSDSVQEISWEKINAPYFVDTALTIPFGFTLNIAPGTEIRLKNNGQINADGILEAKGNAQNKIIFTGASGVPGGWRYIKFSASSTDSILEHVIVSYGGAWDNWGGPKYGAIRLDGLNLTIKDSIFENNRVGIELINGDFSSQSQDIIIQDNEVGIYVPAGDCPDLSGATFGTGDDANTINVSPSSCNP